MPTRGSWRIAVTLFDHETEAKPQGLGFDPFLCLVELRTALPAAQLLVTNVFHMTGWKRYAPRDRGSPALTAGYNHAIAGLARAHGLPLADVSAAMAQRDYLINEDNVHGLDLGHRLIGHRVFEAVATQTDSLLKHGHVSLPKQR